MECWWLGNWRGALLGTLSSALDRADLSKATMAIAKEFCGSSKHNAKKLRQQIEVRFSFLLVFIYQEFTSDYGKNVICLKKKHVIHYTSCSIRVLCMLCIRFDF